MFRAVKLKPEKIKIKVVFRLQFHASQIPYPGWDKLFVSFTPFGSGKATAKTNKANVRNGNCKWSDPIYETAQLVQDAKTKQYDEKLYKLVVATGSSRSSILGEATINLANYVDALKPASAALSLDGNNSAAVLHVMIQLLTSKTGFREFEQQRENRERKFELFTNAAVCDSAATPFCGTTGDDQGNKANAEVSSKSNVVVLSSFGEEGEAYEGCSDTALGDEGSSHTSESIYNEKNEFPRSVFDNVKCKTCEFTGLSPTQSLQFEKDRCCPSMLARRNNDGVHQGMSDTDIVSTTAFGESNKLDCSLAIAEAFIQELKCEMSMLQNLADHVGSEVQLFSTQLAVEIASGQEMKRVVLMLKSECSKLKDDVKQHICSENVKLKSDPEGSLSEGLADTIDMTHVESSDREGSPSKRLADTGDMTFEKLSKGEHECLMGKMNQMECYYQSLIQNFEMNQNQMMIDLQNARHENASYICTISAFETQMEKLHLDMHEQSARFTKERRDLDVLNKELEKRVLASEAAARRLRRYYTFAVGQLQKDLELLSVQVLSLFETNENVIRKAFAEASKIYIEEDMLLETGEELCKKPFEASNSSRADSGTFNRNVRELKDEFKVIRISEESDAAILDRDLDNVSISHELGLPLPCCNGLQRKQDYEYFDACFHYLHLIVYSTILEDTLQVAYNENISMRERVHTLEGHLKQANQFRELLAVKLQSALDDTEIFRNYEAECLSRCESLTLENHILKEKLHDTLAENCFLSQKVTEYERCISSCRNYEQMYQKCDKEKNELERLIMQHDVEKNSLQIEITSVLKELKMLKVEFHKQLTSKNNLKKTIDLLQDKLFQLKSSIISYTRQIYWLELPHSSLWQKTDCTDLIKDIIHVEEFLNRICEHTCQVNQEMKNAEILRERILSSLAGKDSQIQHLREGFLLDIHTLKVKLDLAGLDTKQLQQEIQVLSDKIVASNEADERHVDKNRELSAELEALDAGLHDLASENERLADTIQTFRHVSEDLAKTHLALAACEEENKILMQFLQAGSAMSAQLADELSGLNNLLKCNDNELQNERNMRYEMEARAGHLASLLNKRTEVFAQKCPTSEHVDGEVANTHLALAACKDENKTITHSLQECLEVSAHLANELSSLKEMLRCTTDELQSERSSRIEVEVRATYLASLLDETSKILMSLDNYNTEIIRLGQTILDLELESQKTKELLLHHQKLEMKATEATSFLHEENLDLTYSLVAMHELALADDIEKTFMKYQSSDMIKDLCEQIYLLHMSNEELHLWHLDAISSSNNWRTSQTHFAEENSRMVMALKSWKLDIDRVSDENRKLELERCKIQAAVSIHEGGQVHVPESLEAIIMDLRQEVEGLKCSKDELEITVIILKSKLDELQDDMLLQEENHGKIVKLQNQYDELSYKLVDQVLKAEEFKHLSIHLRELKDKAEAKYLYPGDNREFDAPVAPVHESLQIAFIREQYETKMQEMRSQLDASKKHANEMLLKLQNMLDETECLKKSESSLRKRNENLSIKILDMESELQMVLSEKWAKANAYDKIKIELENCNVCRDCCKEEKTNLEIALQKCNADKRELVSKIELLKVLPANLAFIGNIKEQNGATTPHPPVDIIINANLQDGFSSVVPFSDMNTTEGGVLQSDAKQVAIPINILKGHNLDFNMDHLHKELEKLKDESMDIVPEHTESCSGPCTLDVQKELLQVDLANTRLGAIWPLFEGLSKSGNALERVLAMEIELAEVFRSKNKSIFQSARQDSDDAAVFQCFRDINEMIYEMLELKRRCSAAETGLEQMHGLYSKLRLQFAETDGERERLSMMLKNFRPPKKSS